MAVDRDMNGARGVMQRAPRQPGPLAGSGRTRQDFPTLRLIFRPADERRPDRDVLAGFRGCEAVRARTQGPFPAPDDSFSMSVAAFRRV